MPTKTRTETTHFTPIEVINLFREHLKLKPQDELTVEYVYTNHSSTYGNEPPSHLFDGVKVTVTLK